MPQLATICYIDNGKELLMLHRNKKPNDVHAGKWIGVGGKLERGETPQEWGFWRMTIELKSYDHYRLWFGLWCRAEHQS